MNVERQRVHKPTENQSTSKASVQHKPAMPTAAEAIQRAQELPAERLRIEDVMQLQQTLGNRATAKMLNPPPPPKPTKPTDGGLVQRDYTGALIIYSTIESEKDTGEISTGWKLHSTLTKRVQTFHTALQSGSLTKVRSALTSIMERLNKDSSKKLKSPKNISKSQQTQLATTFFAKWKRITQEHIDFLNLHGQSGVGELQTAYHYPVSKDKDELILIDEGESSSSSETSGALDFDNPPWDSVKSGVYHSSGMGGAVIVTFTSGEKIVVKSGGNGGGAEILGARMARESGLPTANIRWATGTENGLFPGIFTSLGLKNIPWGKPYLVVQFLSGVPVDEALGGGKTPKKEQVQALAASLGRWFAFTILTGDIDNNYLVAGTGRSLNTGNFLANPKTGSVSGFDQHAFSGNLSKQEQALEVIKTGDGYFAEEIGNLVLDALGKPKGVSVDSLIPIVMRAAQEQIVQSTRALTREKIAELAQGTGASNVGDIIDRVEGIGQMFR